MNKILSKKYFIYLFVLVFIVVATFAVYYIAPNFILKIFGKDTFSEYYNKDGSYKNTEVSEKLNLLEEMQLMGLGTDSTTYWDNWNWQDHMFIATVIEVDKENDDILVSFGDYPQNQKFTNNIQRVLVQCAPEQSGLVSSRNPTLALLKTDLSVLDYATKGDFLFSYCLDENCLNVGNVCLVTQREE